MIVGVNSSSDFGSKVVTAFYDLIEKGEPGATLEVRVAPGTYAGVQLSVDDSFDPVPVGIVIAAEDPAKPPVLSDPALGLTARSVALEHLVIRQTHGPKPIQIRPLERFAIEHCAFVDVGRAPYPPAGSVITVMARSPAAVGVIEDTWFIGGAANTSALATVDADPPAAFDRLELTRVAWVDIRCRELLAIGGVRHVELDECLFYQPQPATDAGDAPQLVRLSWAESTLALGRSVVVAASPAHLVAAAMVGSEAARLSECRVWLAAGAGEAGAGGWLDWGATTPTPLGPDHLEARRGAVAALAERVATGCAEVDLDSLVDTLLG